MLGCNRFCSMNGFCFQADRRSTSLGGDAPRRGKGEAIGDGESAADCTEQ